MRKAELWLKMLLQPSSLFRSRSLPGELCPGLDGGTLNWSPAGWTHGVGDPRCGPAQNACGADGGSSVLAVQALDEAGGGPGQAIALFYVLSAADIVQCDIFYTLYKVMN